MTPLTGQRAKIGHFLQPTAMAIGQIVIWRLHGGRRARRIPRERDRAAIPNPAAMLECQDAPGDDERDEREMDRDEGIGQKTRAHARGLPAAQRIAMEHAPTRYTGVVQRKSLIAASILVEQIGEIGKRSMRGG